MKSAKFLCAAALLSACASSEGGAGSAPAPAPEAAASGPRANGSLGEWQPLGAMPTPRGTHCAVAAGGWLVAIGGNHKPKGASDFVTIASVHAAKINDDGTLGSWQLAGETPSAVSSCTAAAEGDEIVLLDGIYADEGAGKSMHAARIDAEGKLGAWRDAGALPDGVRAPYSSATIRDGELLAFHARLPDAGDAIGLVRARLDGGKASAWSDASWLEGFRGHPQYVFAGAYVYALGGYAGPDRANVVLADGAGVRLDAIGEPGASFSVTPLPKATAFGDAIAIDDWVFVVGGKGELMKGTGRSEVYAARIAEDGALSEWTEVSPLPQGRTSHALVASGDFLYIVGGSYDSGGLDTVFSARVRFEAE